MENAQRFRRILWYGIPAYGHVYSNLYLARHLAEKGFTVIYYSMEEFRPDIEAHGCECRIYPIREKELDLTDGQKIIKLYRLILQYTENMMPFLLEEAEREQPCGVIFDSLALWGKIVGQLIQVPSFSFYSIASIERIAGKGFLEYMRGFSVDFLNYAGEFPQAWKIKDRIVRKWNARKLGMISVLMGNGDWNLMGYSRLFQPGGKKFGEKYRFLGPLAVYRQEIRNNDFVCPQGKMIYISLGTIFNQDERLISEVIKQFGSDHKDEEFSVVMVWNRRDEEKEIEFPDNFIVRKFVNQKEVLRRACLFISAGGMNSIHEALYYGVPCLMCPQQGEQLLNARRFEKLGFGKILRNPDKVRKEAEAAMRLRLEWDEKKRLEMTKVSLEQMDIIWEQMRGVSGDETGK